MLPPVRYANSGGVHIAYQVSGEGTVDLVWAPPATSHLELAWENPYQRRVFERLGSFCRLIRFDKRGTGLSDPVAEAATLEERTDDIRAVMDAAGSGQAHLLGTSEGGSMACVFAATHPDRAVSLSLWGATPRGTWAPDYPWAPRREDLEEELAAREARGPQPPELTEPLKHWMGAVHQDPAFVEAFLRQIRFGATPAMRLALARLNLDIDVREVLAAVRIPALVMVRADDPVVHADAARDMAARIPGAAFEVFGGYGHLFHDIWEEVTGRIERFITGTQHVAPTDRVLATLVFADIVGSTERVVRLGDAAWRDLLERYYALVRSELAVSAGLEVDTAGDGLMARFDGPGRAIRCARRILRVGSDLGVEVRAGVHTGEVELARGAVRGIAVHTAARIASLAGPGEVYVSSTVRDLVAGSGLDFVDRGVHALKGLPEPRQLLVVA